MPAIIDPGRGPLTANGAARRSRSSNPGAILQYLGRKFGKFYPSDERAPRRGRSVAVLAGWRPRPMAGQAHHFRQYAPEKIAYGIDRYTNEVNRLYGVMNKRLADREFLAGDYSIADIASLGWVKPYKNQGQELEDFPHLKRWFDTLLARPAVSRGLAVGEDHRRNLADDKEAQKVLFGQRARA
jgi:GST-like protein